MTCEIRNGVFTILLRDLEGGFIISDFWLSIDVYLWFSFKDSSVNAYLFYMNKIDKLENLWNNILMSDI